MNKIRTKKGGTINTKQVCEALEKGGVYPDQFFFKAGVYTVREGFYYTHGRSAEDLANEIKAAIPSAEIVDCCEIWKPFIGGAPIERQSHWLVRFKIDQKEER